MRGREKKKKEHLGRYKEETEKVKVSNREKREEWWLKLRL